MPAGNAKARNAGLHKALSHPVRYRILSTLDGGRVASPAELSQEFGMPVANVAYHFKMLLRLDAIELVSTRPVRGTLEHFYRSIVQPAEALDEIALPPRVRGALAGNGLVEAWERVKEASGEGGLEDERSQISSSSLHLDERGQREVEAILDDAIKRVAAIQAAATKRLTKIPEDERQGQHTELALMYLMRNPKQG
jgi:DNA-binding transcriptional ArsR family regulator